MCGSPPEDWRHRHPRNVRDSVRPLQSPPFSPPSTRWGSPTSSTGGGPAGFVRVLDENTIGFVDFTGNRQYAGNLADNPKVHLSLIDYACRRRVKIWGEARVVEGDGGLTAKLMPAGLRRAPSR